VVKKEKLNTGMKKLRFLLFCFLFISNTNAQEIVNFVLVGDKGITQNINEAHSFIVIKKYPGNYQRLDYKIGAPLETLRSYSDSTLEILQGNYYAYTPDGKIALSGYYHNNLKEKNWYYYNDTGKVILEDKFVKGVLIETINPDTLKKEERADDIKTVEKEATFGKGDRDWIRYLSKNLNADIALNSVKGGEVSVMFVVNKEGQCVDIHLKKSVEFVLDEEAIRIIEQSPRWQPAIQNGRIVNAYRVQPITFVK
jgi:periplasmic protein TonB